VKRFEDEEFWRAARGIGKQEPVQSSPSLRQYSNDWSYMYHRRSCSQISGNIEALAVEGPTVDTTMRERRQGPPSYQPGWAADLLAVEPAKGKFKGPFLGI